jgi:hypothetical protein
VSDDETTPIEERGAPPQASNDCIPWCTDQSSKLCSVRAALLTGEAVRCGYDEEAGQCVLFYAPNLDSLRTKFVSTKFHASTSDCPMQITDDLTLCEPETDDEICEGRDRAQVVAECAARGLTDFLLEGCIYDTCSSNGKSDDSLLDIYDIGKDIEKQEAEYRPPAAPPNPPQVPTPPTSPCGDVEENILSDITQLIENPCSGGWDSVRAQIEDLAPRCGGSHCGLTVSATQTANTLMGLLAPFARELTSSNCAEGCTAAKDADAWTSDVVAALPEVLKKHCHCLNDFAPAAGEPCDAQCMRMVTLRSYCTSTCETES